MSESSELITTSQINSDPLHARAEDLLHSGNLAQSLLDSLHRTPLLDSETHAIRKDELRDANKHG